MRVLATIAFVLLLMWVIEPLPEAPKTSPDTPTYDTYAELYREVSNDKYTQIYSKASYEDQGDMVAAARKECAGYLEEDFSCDESQKRGTSPAIIDPS